MLRAAVVVAVASALPVALASAADLPSRKSGLWEVTMNTAGAPPTTMKMCIDKSTDDMSRSMGQQMSQGMCSKNEMRREGDRFVTESVCKMGPSTASSRGVFSGDFSSSYTMEMTTTYDPPMGGMRNSTMKANARWIGPCSPGMKPGDMELPGGMRVNPMTMKK